MTKVGGDLGVRVAGLFVGRAYLLPDLEKSSGEAGRPGGGGGGGTASRVAEEGGWATNGARELVGEFSMRWL